MSNAAWWARVVQARTERADLLPERVWAAPQGRTRRRDRPEGVARHRRRDRAEGGRGVAHRRLFRSHEQAELVGAIADTRTMFEGKGWE